MDVRRGGPGDKVVTASLTLAMAAGTLIAYAPGTMAPFLVDQFGLTVVHVGALAAAPSAVGALLSPIAGRWVDAAGGRLALGALFISAGAALAILGGAQSFGALLFACSMGGLGVALSNPVTDRLIVDMVSADRRYMAFGIKQSGVQVGAALVGLTLPGLSLLVGSRVALELLASIVVSGAAVILLMGDASSVGCWSAPPGVPRMESGPASSLSRIRVYALLSGVGIGAAGVHVPLFAYREIVSNAVVAGVFAGTLAFAGVLARIVWGGLGQRIVDVPGVLSLMAVASAGATFLIILAGSAESVMLMWLGSALLGVGSSWNVLGVLHVIRGRAPGSAGAISGRIQASYLSGLVAGPLLFGVLTSIHGCYAFGWLFVACSFACAASIALFWRGDGIRS